MDPIALGRSHGRLVIGGRAVFDDLISSGETQLIRSDSLRLVLAGYPAQLAQLRYADAQAWATWEDRIQPFLEGRIPRVDRLRRGTFGRSLDERTRELIDEIIRLIEKQPGARLASG